MVKEKAEMEERSHSPSLARRVFNLLLAGLAAIIPIVGTLWLLSVIYRVLLEVGQRIIYGIVGALDWLRGIRYDDDGNRKDALEEEAWSSILHGWDSWFWFLIPILLLGLVGAAVTNRPGQAILNWVDRSITKVPFMGFLYSTLKQGVDSFRNLGGPRKFRGVAYVEYPSPGCRLFGFITGGFSDQETGKQLTSVFVPTSPNPLTGFVIVVDEDRLIPSDLTVEEATKLLLSAGLVAPERMMADMNEAENKN